MRHLPFVALIAYALHGVGVCCDDFPQIVLRGADAPVEEWLATPALIATHGLAYGWLGYGNFWLYDVLKIGWVALAYGLVYRFGALWFPPARAAMSALGSFESYGSPPWAIGLSLVFLLQRKYRQAAALLVPQFIYVAYYVALTEWYGMGSKRLPSAWNPEAVLKQFALQILGGLDAVLGPSLLLKVWWSVASLTLASAALGAVIWILILRDRQEPAAPRIPAAMWAGVLAVMLAGFGVFALTGSYPQSAFGMGNRVTIYASFAAAFALAALPLPRAAHAALAGALVFATLGISDHWRAWRGVQDRTIAAIGAHPALGDGNLGKGTVFVAGRDYSRLGPLGHIALFTEPWVADAVFALALGERKTYPVVPLTARFRATPDGLLDTRQGALYPVGAQIAVYLAETDSLRFVERGDIGPFVQQLQAPPRHWIHLVEVPWLREWILRWMPQLGYLFGDKSKLAP